MSGSSESERLASAGEPAEAPTLGSGAPPESVRPETVPDQPAAEPRVRAAVLAGAVGGAIAAILIGFVLDAAGLFDRTDAVLTSRVAAIEGLAPELRSDTSRLAQRLMTVEERPIPETDLAPLRGETATLRDETAALRGDVAGLHDALAKQESAAELARASLDQGLRELRETTSGLTLSLAEQRARLDTLTAQRPDLQPLGEGLAAARSAMAAQEGRLADLARRLETLEGTLVAARVDAAQTAGLALALVELDRALDAGEPLAAALDPFLPLAEDPAIKAPLDLLQPLRTEGAPTVADLQASLTALRPSIAEAMRHVGVPGWLGQTAQNLASLVDLRRADAAEAAIAGRLDAAEQALGRGEVDAAAEAMRPLAESGNTAAADWLAQARRRMNGESGLERLRAYLAAHMPASP